MSDPSGGHWVDVLLTNYPGGTRSSAGRWFSPGIPDDTFGAGWSGDTGQHSQQAFLDAWAGDVAAGSVDNDPGIPDTASAGFGIDTFYAGGSYGWLTQIYTSVRSDAWQVAAAPNLPTPATLGDVPDWVANGWLDASQADWVEGVDYATRPGAEPGDTYADFTYYAVTYTWAPATIVAQPSGFIDDGLTSGYDPATLDFAVLVSNAAPPLHSTAIPTTPDGTPLTTVGATLDADQAPVPIVFTPPAGQPIAVHLRLSDGPPTTPPLSSFDESGSHIGWAVNIGRFTVAYTVVITGIRVWAPGLAWHTIGGHWDRPVVVSILTPGVGWVPIIDGPA